MFGFPRTRQRTLDQSDQQCDQIYARRRKNPSDFLPDRKRISHFDQRQRHRDERGNAEAHFRRILSGQSIANQSRHRIGAVHRQKNHRTARLENLCQFARKPRKHVQHSDSVRTGVSVKENQTRTIEPLAIK